MYVRARKRSVLLHILALLQIFSKANGERDPAMHIFYVMSPSPPFLPGIFCVKRLNWILKTADLTESSGRLDERPVKNGETDGMNPQTRQRGRPADGSAENDGENDKSADRPRGPLSMSKRCFTFLRRIWTFYPPGQVTIQAYLRCIRPPYNCKIRRESAVITIIQLLSVINRQAGASVEEGFKCLFT